MWLLISGRPTPSALPAQTPTMYLGVTPILQASLKPSLVPVFHAIFCLSAKDSQKASLKGRFPEVSSFNVRYAAPCEIGKSSLGARLPIAHLINLA